MQMGCSYIAFNILSSEQPDFVGRGGRKISDPTEDGICGGMIIPPCPNGIKERSFVFYPIKGGGDKDIDASAQNKTGEKVPLPLYKRDNITKKDNWGEGLDVMNKTMRSIGSCECVKNATIVSHGSNDSGSQSNADLHSAFLQTDNDIERAFKDVEWCPTCGIVLSSCYSADKDVSGTTLGSRVRDLTPCTVTAYKGVIDMYTFFGGSKSKGSGRVDYESGHAVTYNPDGTSSE